MAQLNDPVIITLFKEKNFLTEITIQASVKTGGDQISFDYEINGGGLVGAVVLPLRGDSTRKFKVSSLSASDGLHFEVIYQDSTAVNTDSNTVDYFDVLPADIKLQNDNFDATRHEFFHGKPLQFVKRDQEDLAQLGGTAATDVAIIPQLPGDAFRIIGDNALGKVTAFDNSTGEYTVQLDNIVVQKLNIEQRFLNDELKKAQFVADHTLVGVTELKVNDLVVNTTDEKIYTVNNIDAGTTGNLVVYQNSLTAYEGYILADSESTDVFRFDGTEWVITDNGQAAFLNTFQTTTIPESLEGKIHYV